MFDHDTQYIELRSYGRRHGRKLSLRQSRLLTELLPQVAADASSLAVSQSPIWLEIGFGGGEHLLHQAKNNSGITFVGAEPFEDGVVKVLSAIEAEQLSNIRVFADDARPLLRSLKHQSVAKSFVLFPDPWPKKKHAKRRLLSEATIDLLARASVPGGELRVATDIGDYARTLLIAMRNQGGFDWIARSPEDWRTPWPDWPGTRYEAKAKREGRQCYYFTFQKRALV
jgi:tRNA (guanine-N7-)-methyltransferase